MSHLNDYKIIFAGPVGAGKTTAIGTISDKPPVSTNRLATDFTSAVKPETTVAMDYGMMKLDDGAVLHLYGTPGQDRFDFMWDILVTGGVGLVLLIDNRRTNPFEDLRFYLNSFKGFIQDTGVVIGVTGVDVQPKPSHLEYRDELIRLGFDVPTFSVDAREKRDMVILLESLLFSLSYK